MTEPLDTMMGDECEQTTLDLFELFEESDSEDDFDNPNVGEPLHDFLTLTIKGPQVDEETVVLLFNNGVVDIRSFLLYSKQSYQEILSNWDKEATHPESKHATRYQGHQDLRRIRFYP